MNPYLAGLGTSGASSALSQLLSPLAAPRRALWNAADILTGGTAHIPLHGIPALGPKEDVSGESPAQHSYWGTSPIYNEQMAPSDMQPPDSYERAKSPYGLVPLIGGLAGGIGLAAATGGVGPAIIGALLSSGALQALGENFSQDNGADFKPAETSELYRRLGIESHPLLDTATEMALDPMNLLGFAAASKLGNAAKAAEAGQMAATEGRLAQQAAIAADQSIRPAGAMHGFEGLTARSMGFGAPEAESPLLNALGGAAPERMGDARLGEIRQRLMELMADNPAKMASMMDTAPMNSATMTDMMLPSLPIPGRTPALPATARPTMTDIDLRPILPIPRKPTSAIPPPSKRYAL